MKFSIRQNRSVIIRFRRQPFSQTNIHFQQNSTVVFDINNLDSNYTNGFLTRSTLININALFLLPKIFFRNNCSLLKDFWKKTNAIERAKRCVEIASGAPLTEAEINATKKSEINPECPALANPNYEPYAVQP